MNNIIIVEDILERGITLAQQFEEFARDNQDFGIRVLAVCYFHPNKKTAQELIAKREEENGGYFSFEIRPVNLWDFDEVLDEYTDPNGKRATAVIDFILKGDGSDEIPTRRVNVRYARRAGKDRMNRIKFYTATGTNNENILRELFGENHVLKVEELRNDDNYLHLHLDREVFVNKLQTNAVAV